MALPRDLKSGGTLSAISNNFEMVIGWTGLLANRIDRENEKPDRTIDFKTTKLLAVDSLKSLIILRGPAGSGKTTICNAMVEVLGAYHSNILDLDITGSQEYKFERNLRNCLSSEYVIGMMFYGNSHTTEPSKWIEKFQERGTKFYPLSYTLVRRHVSTGVVRIIILDDIPSTKIKIEYTSTMMSFTHVRKLIRLLKQQVSSKPQ